MLDLEYLAALGDYIPVWARRLAAAIMVVAAIYAVAIAVELLSP